MDNVVKLFKRLNYFLLLKIYFTYFDLQFIILIINEPHQCYNDKWLMIILIFMYRFHTIL